MSYLRLFYLLIISIWTSRIKELKATTIRYSSHLKPLRDASCGAAEVLANSRHFWGEISGVVTGQEVTRLAGIRVGRPAGLRTTYASRLDTHQRQCRGSHGDHRKWLQDCPSASASAVLQWRNRTTLSCLISCRSSKEQPVFSTAQLHPRQPELMILKIFYCIFNSLFIYYRKVAFYHRKFHSLKFPLFPNWPNFANDQQ